jgi:ribonuclease E
MPSKRQLIVNYVPGEECRIAVVNDGKLDEFYSERADAVSHVGNIYVGRVINVEPAISAAFVDFGLEHNGFLHVTDLHPRYFPGEDKSATERVGKKTPRRERPAIQDALRRGQEITVQVLKEGVGTKGPTLTSYLSIPGRYLVMMPDMDRTGVSRKVEDEEQRAKMKSILDELELPEGFGFIVRTAGLERTKTELKRDLAYLVRLQKDMERRRKGGSKPRLLYSESDLLVRALRDMVTADTDSIIIDSELAVKRAARFMKIVAPRTVTKLVHYTGHTPIYHALGVEEQIRTIYAREVPLPSGGRLVIDEAEALVAIDVNSGKSRSSGDSETNAFRTNLEAADEICRQLRLRDLGGIVVNDLIDMRLAKHRREVEAKFEEILQTDRARSTCLPISEFGILEMTRQRMRGSHESLHFMGCPSCHGRGLVQRPESVAADGLRELAALLDHAKVRRVEMVVHPRVASELLSGKRRTLNRLERQSNKAVTVRLSEATATDRVTFYAYDENNADIELDRLPSFKVRDEHLVPYTEPGVTDTPEEEEGWAADPALEGGEEAPEAEVDPLAQHDPAPLTDDDQLRPRHRERGEAGRGDRGAGRDGHREGRHGPDSAGAPAQGAPAGDGEGGGRRRGRRRRGRGRGRGGDEGAPMVDGGAGAPREGEAGQPVGGTARGEGHSAAPPGSAGDGGFEGDGRGGFGDAVADAANAPADGGGEARPEGADDRAGIEAHADGTGSGSDAGGEHFGEPYLGPDGEPNVYTSGREGPAPGGPRSDDRDGGPGEGGGRRRRRRRGGRGRGRGGEGQAGALPGQPVQPGLGSAPQGGGRPGGERPPVDRPAGTRGEQQRGGGPRPGQGGGGRGRGGAGDANSIASRFRADAVGTPAAGGEEPGPNDRADRPARGDGFGGDAPGAGEFADEAGVTEPRDGPIDGSGDRGSEGPNGRPGDERGGGRRRRGRRGGRGRGRGDGRGGGMGQGGQSGAAAPGPNPGFGGASGGGGVPRPNYSAPSGQGGAGSGSGGGGSGDGGGGGGRPGPMGGPSASSPPKPRGLYAFNRRLKPGERPPMKRDE